VVLAGLTLDTSAGNVAAPEWVRLATVLVVGHVHAEVPGGDDGHVHAEAPGADDGLEMGPPVRGVGQAGDRVGQRAERPLGPVGQETGGLAPPVRVSMS
jgi:hypothetical protein